MKWSQSDRKVITILVIIGVVLYVIYKGLQLLAGLTVGGSFGVGLGGMSGKQQIEQSRTVETDAPAQVIYRIDDHRFLTLENYMTCALGGQVYYNDTNKKIKTYLGEEPGNEEWRYKRGNDLLAYRGEIINAATTGELAFGIADSRSYCGSGNSSSACPVSFIYSSDDGRSFSQVSRRNQLEMSGNHSERYKFVILDREYYLQDNEERGDKAVVRVRMENGKFISSYKEREREYLRRFKQELTKRGIEWGEDKGVDYYPSEYRFTDEYKKNKTYEDMVKDDVAFMDASVAVRKAMSKDRIAIPSLKNFSVDEKYHCDSAIKAKNITYINQIGQKETVKYEQ